MGHSEQISRAELLAIISAVESRIEPDWTPARVIHELRRALVTRLALRLIEPMDRLTELRAAAGRHPRARTLGTLSTPRQLIAINAMAAAKGIDAESVCMETLECRPAELSKRAASAFIDYLKKLPRETHAVKEDL